MRAARAGFRVFQNEIGNTRLTDKLKKDAYARVILYEDIAAIDAITKSQEECKSLGVTYDQVWRQWSDETDAKLAELAKKVEFWWRPSVQSGLILSAPTMMAVWLTLLDGFSLCGLNLWVASSVALGAVVVPFQRHERSISYKAVITKRMILDHIAKCRQRMGEATKKD
jgi:hypothetical protein